MDAVLTNFFIGQSRAVPVFRILLDGLVVDGILFNFVFLRMVEDVGDQWDALARHLVHTADLDVLNLVNAKHVLVDFVIYKLLHGIDILLILLQRRYLVKLIAATREARIRLRVHVGVRTRFEPEIVVDS